MVVWRKCCKFATKSITSNGLHMKKMKNVKLLLLVVLTAILASCGTTSQVPVTGRKQRLVVSDEEVMSLSNQEYQLRTASGKCCGDLSEKQWIGE